MHFACLWITACIHLHTFAMDHEDAQFITKDNFFKLGKRIMRRERQKQREWDEAREQVAEQIEADMEERGEVELLEGKLKHEKFIKKTIHALKYTVDISNDVSKIGMNVWVNVDWGQCYQMKDLSYGQLEPS